jgi:hypothetical protein
MNQRVSLLKGMMNLEMTNSQDEKICWIELVLQNKKQKEKCLKNSFQYAMTGTRCNGCS